MGAKILLSTTVVWPAAARLAGGFAAGGCTVDVLCPRGHPIAKSRYLNRRTVYDALLPLVSLREAIAGSQPDLIVPCDDRAVTQLLELYDRVPAADRTHSPLAKLIARSLGTPERYPQLMSRYDFIAAAQRAGIGAPETLPVNSEAGLKLALSKIGLPAVLKQDSSWGGDGVAILQTLEDALLVYRKWRDGPSRLRNFVRALRRRDAHFLPQAFIRTAPPPISLQQFVAGHPATSAMACWEGKVLASIHMDVLVTQRSKGPACVLRRRHSAAMDDAARCLAQTFGLSGLHGIDYVRDPSGALHLLEINPRATQVSYLPLGAGHDLVSALAGAVSGKPVAARPAIAADTIALFPQEMVRDPASPYLESAYHDVPADDPGVHRALLRAAKWTRLRQNFRTIPRLSVHFLETLRP